VQQNPIDAIPDLSENQVIVFTEWMGRSPQVIEDQVTYPWFPTYRESQKSKTSCFIDVWDEFCLHHF
jgi:Cu/Ag efflux pump CusA